MARRFALMFLSIVTGFLLTGCGGAVSPTTAQTQQPSSTNETYTPNIDPSKFTSKIDNPHFPLTPGTTYIYEGPTDEGTEHNEVTVTHDTKTILGVDCVVVHDTVSRDGELIEDTLDWYAQDSDGNVWYFGEDSKSYENGQVVSTEGSWEAGVDGAQPGIIMEAHPQAGDSYRQEYYAGHAEDMADVLSLSESVSVPYGDFTQTLKTKDWTPLEPTVIENKYYAKGVGFVLETMEGSSERIELIDVRKD